MNFNKEWLDTTNISLQQALRFLTHPFPVIPTHETKKLDTSEASIKEQVNH